MPYTQRPVRDCEVSNVSILKISVGSVWQPTQRGILRFRIRQRPSEVNSRSASREIPRFLYNPKAHYRADKNPSLAFILSQMNSVHIITPCFFNSFLYYPPIYGQVFLVVAFLRIFPTKFLHILISPMRAACSAHVILAD